MTIAKVRELDKYGVLPDMDPFTLPPGAFSFGNNVRFRQGAIRRAPVFRSALAFATIANPRYIYALPSSSFDVIYVGQRDGKVFNVDITGGTETDYSIAGYSTNNSESAWTGCFNADVVYINRPDRVPWYIVPGTSQFAELTNWTSTWRCNILRACAGALVALNITKGPTNYPSMIKTSSFPASGDVPSSWDETTPSTLATENTLTLRGGIRDAQNFGNHLIIYGTDGCWLMQKTSSFEVWDYTKLPFQKGAISADCVVEVDGRHYVFGPDDIWVHDGVSEKSIAEGRVRQTIYSSMNATYKDRFFVVHNPNLQEIMFCYCASDGYNNFNLATDPNRAAVYNYAKDQWQGFDDLPYVRGAAFANLSQSVTYSTYAGTYAEAGGTYTDLEDGFKRTPVFVGITDATYSLVDSMYAYDIYGSGSIVSYSVDTNANKKAYLERNGIDLDQFPDIDLSFYKILDTIYPLGTIASNANTTLSFEVGSSDYYGVAATFDGTAQTYDGDTLYKLDFNMAGRYLALKITYDDYTAFTLAGLDLDIKLNGKR